MDLPVLVAALSNERLLELAKELKIKQVVGRQRLLTYHGLHGLHVLA